MNKTIRSEARQMIYSVYLRCLAENEAGEVLVNIYDVYERAAFYTDCNALNYSLLFYVPLYNAHIKPEPVAVGEATIEVVQEYVYLGQTIRLGRSNFDKEAARRIQLGWAAFGKLRHIFSSAIPQSLKTKVFNQCVPKCVLPVMTYGAETWTLTIFHIQATFTWNFSDLFVICISYYLIRRLQLVNKKLHAICGKKYGESFWRSTREQYGRATQLVRRVDRVISGVVFISFANNLFFICLQLFHTLEVQPVAGFITTLYFSFSLVYLLTRSVSMSLIAAQVHTASTVPAPVLYNVSSSEYCEEVQRFVSQVNGEKVALSGLQFFSVTRGLLLTVAGTIVTYELVMFQINSPGSRNYVTPDPSTVTNISSVFST
ncbi:unnamed protein product [Plutella xylostella]|uniref:(diamondback moth) hypothetical protein n=1 Tax=Plutella xylostella TaxID=51655 RepID=A0A8S4E790_PLUXY|nr:unnamed protein product [Plutella xylostella]